MSSTRLEAPDEFHVGDIVTLRAQPEVSGAVVQVLAGGPEPRYLVFTNGRTATYYARQLQPLDTTTQLSDVLPLREFQARLTALLLRQPSLRTLYSLHAARVNFIPYQFRPVLKFIRADRPMMLIADEVGVGKTIEAGLILREMQARRDVRSVLIICPRPLVTERKWQSEMKRFDEDFVHLDGPTLQHCLRETDLSGVWPDKYAKAILPFSLFDERLLSGENTTGRRRAIGLLELDPPPAFDLVIVDEAHHLRNTNTFTHRGAAFFVQNAEAVVFLTATPIQLASDDLFVLLNLLRPDVVIDRESFSHMTEPNPFINAASGLVRAAAPGWEEEALGAMVAAGETPWGRAVLGQEPTYQLVCRRLGGTAALTPQERLSCIRDIEGLHTLANLINRTRRRDIGSFTTRKAETVEVEFTPPQRRLHDALLAAQARILERTHGSRAVKFLMTTIRRQAASSLYGLAPLIEAILTRRLSELEWDELDEGADDLADDPSTIQDAIAEVLALARALDGRDPKLDALRQIIVDKQALPNNKLLLFSSFRHTLRYLHQHLADTGVRVGLIHGDVPDEERAELRRRFSLDRADSAAVDLLLSSEIGCEGLDFQFCDGLVNFDLPWNPMRVEQRIGRIDRYGQKSETVVIYNLVTPGTVDFDIYERCLLRIGLFRQALGGNEEILGRVTSELRSVAENLTLSEEERQARLQQLADNDIRLLQEQEKLEREQEELFGIVLPPEQVEREVEEANSPWLRPSALQNLVQTYLTTTVGGDDHILGERPLKTLRLSQEARSRLLVDFRNLPRQTSPLHRDWERWLKGGEYLLEITFDAAQAADTRSATFITPIHPLAQQSASLVQSAPPFRTAFRVRTDDAAAGNYPFVIYDWQVRGIRDDAILQPVCADPSLTERFLSLLEKAEPAKIVDVPFPPTTAFDELEAEHHRLWSSERADHEARTRLMATARLESLRASHRSRMILLREQRVQATDERIRRMRDSQVQTAEADYERRATEIEEAARRADILASVVAQGVLIVEGDL
jgi:ATP-dependent helicase HepA